MRTAGELLAAYDAGHRHPLNKRLHRVCVPLILFSLLALLWGVAVPPLNAAQAVVLMALVYYFVLSPRLAAGMLVLMALLLGLLRVLDQAGLPLVWIAAAVFALAWVGQFIGHHLEGNRPSFFEDLQFLLIGPLWLLAAAYRRLGIAY